MNRPSSNHNRPLLDADALRRIALNYAGRYATTRAKLTAYLLRKIGELGWEGGDARAAVTEIVGRFAELGYVDDQSFARARAASLGRRGYGERRVSQVLRAAGITDEDAAPVREEIQENAWESAMAYARRRRIGPFAGDADDARRRRDFAAMLRAGHDMSIARRISAMRPGEEGEKG